MKKIILSLFFLSSFQLTIAQNTFQIAFETTNLSSKKNFRIPLEDNKGNKAELPISIIKGGKTGPVFTILAGVHGYEYPPIISTQAIMQEINPKELTGTLIIIPIANKGSFFGRTPYISPIDNKNLNNAFPGNQKGSITEQIAHFITKNIIDVTDIFLDIHGGDSPEDLIPFVCYYNNEQKPEQTALAKKLSEKSGFDHVVSYSYTLKDSDPAKYAFKQAVQDGKTALSIESGKLGFVHQENVTLIKKGVYNMLASLNMYGKSIEPPHNVKHFNSQSYVSANFSGIFYSDYAAGDSVQKGAIVGYTTDEFGKIIEKHYASIEGIILYMLATPPINKGDTVMCISTFIEK